MSRELVEQKQRMAAIVPTAQEVDVDAEHDPKVSRRASNAALAREAVQMKAAGKGREPALEAAERGVQSPATALPHADKIQAAFGAHDISHIQAHIGDGSAAAMGAEAYATGNHVVFDKEPDLHTAAHEAAHVVQQAKGVHLYGGVGQAGDAYEQNADAVADRVVQGKSAEDLLGEPALGRAQAGVVQRKLPPSQAYADQQLIHAVQMQVKLAAARINMAAAHVEHAVETMKSPELGAAGVAPLVDGIAAQVTNVTDVLDDVLMAIQRAPDVLRGALDVELAELNNAWAISWVHAMGSVYGATHDKEHDDKLFDFAQGLELSVGPSRRKIDQINQAAGESHARAKLPTFLWGKKDALKVREDELKAAELEAVKGGMYAVETALELVKADLHSSVSDQSKEALALTASVQQLVDVLEPIDPAHIGKISKLPILIKQVESLQAEIMKMKEADEDKGKALAPKLGYGTQLSINLRKLKTKIAEIQSAHKANAKHHH